MAKTSPKMDAKRLSVAFRDQNVFGDGNLGCQWRSPPPREKIYVNPCFTLDSRKHIMDKMRIRDKFTKFVGTI